MKTYYNKQLDVSTNQLNAVGTTDNVHLRTLDRNDENSISDWKSVNYGNNRFLACNATDSKVYFAPDGLFWTETSLTGNYWDAAYYDGLWVIAGYSSKLKYSIDNGYTWYDTNSISADWRFVVYDNGVWLAGGIYTELYQSTDGLNWTAVTSGLTGCQWYDAASDGADNWCAVVFSRSDAGTDYLYYSTDNTDNWSASTTQPGSGFACAAFGATKFVAGRQGTDLYYSSDADTWSTSSAGAYTWAGVSFGNSQFVACPSDGTQPIYYSSNGTSWSSSSSSNLEWMDAAWNGSRWVAVSYNQHSYYSTDAITWNQNGDSIVYIAPNGNDSTGAGTLGNPYLTFDKAINTGLGGSYDCIQVIRNGYVGDMVFDAPTEIIPSSTYLQVELGEEATINKSGISNVQLFTGGNTFWEVAYGNGIYVGTYHPQAVMLRSTDGITWSNVAAALTDKWGYYVIYDGSYFVTATHPTAVTNPGIYNSTDGSSWTRVNASYTHQYLIEKDSVILGLTGGSNPTCYISTDHGVNWSTSITLTGYSVSNSEIFSKDELYFYIFLDNINAYYRSSDGLTWEYITISGVASGLDDIIKGENIYVGRGHDWDSKIYYSTDAINWTLANVYNSTSDLYNGVVYTKGWFFAQGFYDDHILYSTNGIDWYTSNVQPGTNWTRIITANNQVYVMDNYSTCELLLPEILDYYYNSIIINGFNLTGTNLLGAIDGYNTTTHTVKWCDMEDNVSNIEDLTFHNSRILDGDNGLYNVTNPIVYESVFANIDGSAIDHYGDTLNQYNNTFYYCGTAIKVNEAIITNTAFKNMIIDKCGYAVNSVVTALTLTYSVANGSLYNCTIDTNSIANVKALYHDSANDDFKIRHYEEGYPIESIGVEMGDNGRDAGAWDYTFNINSIDWTECDMISQRFDVEKSMIPVKSSTAYTFSSDFRRWSLDYIWNFTIESKEISGTEYLYYFRDMLEYNDLIQFYPMDTGISSQITGAFTWSGSAIDSTVTCIVDSSDLNTFQDFIEDNCAVGWFVIVHSISGATGIDTTYPFKVVEYNHNDELVLENYYSSYPGSGFSASPDGNYEFEVVRTMFTGGVTYDGEDTTITLSEGKAHTFTLTDLNQTMIPNQWKGMWMHLDYSEASGSREYLRILSNTTDEITAHYPDGDISLSATDTAVISIDLILTRSDPQDLSPSQVIKDEVGKHGNDFYQTEITQERATSTYGEKHDGWLGSNDTRQVIVLKQSNDWDKDIQ